LPFLAEKLLPMTFTGGNKMVEISTRKIKKQLLSEIETLKDKRGFLHAGLPRFNRLFGRDAIISAWQLLNIDPEIAKNTIKVLVEYQGDTVNNENEEEPGKIIHEAKGYFPYNYYGAVDTTPLFVILAGFYLRKTKDEKFIKDNWQFIRRAAKWLINYGDKDNDLFIEYQPKNFGGLFHQGWKDGFKDHLKIEPPIDIVEAQGYTYLAFKEAAEMAKLVNDEQLAETFADKAKALKEKFNQVFWMSDRKYFCLGLDRYRKQRKAITSNPGHLLFTGIVDDERTDSVVSRLFGRDLWTAFGIRTHSTKEPDFNPLDYHLGSVWPHDNWIIAQGLKKLGYKDEYQKIKAALLAAHAKIGFLPEFYGVVNNKIAQETEKKACYPQAWASAALLNFLSGR